MTAPAETTDAPTPARIPSPAMLILEPCAPTQLRPGQLVMLGDDLVRVSEVQMLEDGVRLLTIADGQVRRRASTHAYTESMYRVPADEVLRQLALRCAVAVAPDHGVTLRGDWVEAPPGVTSVGFVTHEPGGRKLPNGPEQLPLEGMADDRDAWRDRALGAALSLRRAMDGTPDVPDLDPADVDAWSDLMADVYDNLNAWRAHSVELNSTYHALAEACAGYALPETSDVYPQALLAEVVRHIGRSRSLPDLTTREDVERVLDQIDAAHPTAIREHLAGQLERNAEIAHLLVEQPDTATAAEPPAAGTEWNRPDRVAEAAAAQAAFATWVERETTDSAIEGVVVAEGGVCPLGEVPAADCSGDTPVAHTHIWAQPLTDEDRETIASWGENEGAAP